MKKFLRLALICTAGFFLVMLLVVKEDFFNIIVVSVLMGFGLAAVIHDALYGKKKGRKNSSPNSVSQVLLIQNRFISENPLKKNAYTE